MPSDLPRFDVLLRSEDGDGAVAIIAIAVGAAWEGPPLHHHDFDEAFYVLEGALTFQLGDALRTAGPGELVFAPRGSVHTLANLADVPARYVLVCTPGGFERYFGRLAAELAGEEAPAWARLPSPEVTVVGPPIAGRKTG